jgi:hypothetical protein
MRNWLFRPILFYPLLLVGAALLVLASLSPLSWARPEAPTSGVMRDGALVLEGEALGTPAMSPEQQVFVVRDIMGHASALRVAVIPGQTIPTPAETGVRVLLDDAAARFIEDKPVDVQIDYRPIPLNMASGLAVSLQGVGPAQWVAQPIAVETGSLHFRLPAQMAVNAIGLRALNEGADRNFGVEIVRIRVTPASG